MHFKGLPVTIVVIALATFATRALPFLFFSSREPPEMLSVIEENLLL
ncbi:MAG: AzlD domain-containing protein [Methanosarcina flavescens]